MKAKLALVAAVAALVVVSLLIRWQSNPEEPTPIEPKPPSYLLPGMATRAPGQIATVKTNRGSFRIALYTRDMPATCTNFLDLVPRGFYNGLRFHRVEDWVVQGGDPTGNGMGGSGRNIKLEVRPGLDFQTPYMVGMARSRGRNDSASSQFFINKKPKPGLSDPATGAPYACFGRVFEGQEVVDRLQKGDLMKEITLSEPTEDERALIEKTERVIPFPRPAGGNAPKRP